MGAIAMYAARARAYQVYKVRRLTVPELERYIRRGCVCSVCEFALAEIDA